MFAFGIDLGVFSNNVPTYEDDTVMTLPTLTIENGEALSAIVEDVAGRLENCHDDGTEDSPEAEDLRCALELLEAVPADTGFPHVVLLDDSNIMLQLEISLENLQDTDFHPVAATLNKGL